MSKTKTTPTRRASWTCLDLAFKIQTETYTQKLVLLYLAKCVNDSLVCYPGYTAIRKHTTGTLTDTTIKKVITYLRDVLGILKWRTGSAKSQKANQYTFNLVQMTKVVAMQAEKKDAPTPTAGGGGTPLPTAGGDLPPRQGEALPTAGHPLPTAGDQRSIKQRPPELSREERSNNRAGGGADGSAEPKEETVSQRERRKFLELRRRSA